MDPRTAYFLNYSTQNFSISCSHSTTSICAYGNLITANQPIYYISIAKLASFCFFAWRDGDKSSSQSCLALAARRFTCSIALGALALLGVIDGIIRLTVGIFAFAIQHNSKIFFSEAFGSFLYSLGFVTCFQVWNLYEKSLISKL